MNEFLSTVVLFGDGHGTGVVSGGGFVQSLIFLVVVAIVLGLVLWLVEKAPFLPAIFKQVLTWLVYLVAVLVLINFLLSLAGRPLFVY